MWNAAINESGQGLQLMGQIPANEPTGSGSMRFKRQSRLLKPSEFKHVFQQPFRSGDHCFRILSRFNDKQRHRLGMAVSKKSCPKAVGRNRIKRIVRESFRTQLAGLETAQALDFVILPTAQASGQCNKTLGESLSKQWRRLIQKTAQADRVQVNRVQVDQVSADAVQVAQTTREA